MEFFNEFLRQGMPMNVTLSTRCQKVTYFQASILWILEGQEQGMKSTENDDETWDSVGSSDFLGHGQDKARFADIAAGAQSSFDIFRTRRPNF